MNFKIKSLKIRLTLSLLPLSSFAGLTVLTLLTGASAPGSRAQANKAPTVRHTGVITGQVVTLKGKPIRGAAVSLFGPHPGPYPAMVVNREPFVTVRANSAGQFQAASLPPGRWWFRCEAKGYFQIYDNEKGPEGTFETPPTIYPNAVVGTDGTTASASVQPVQPVLLVMYPKAVLWGRVLDTDGRPVTNQNVWFIWGKDNHLDNSYSTVPVDAQGFYQKEFDLDPYIETFPSFPIEVKEEVKEEEQQNKQSSDALGMFAPGHPGHSPFREFVLHAGKRTRQDYRLVRGASVSGTVYEGDGKTPVAGARVVANRITTNGGVSHIFRAREPGETITNRSLPSGIECTYSGSMGPLLVTWEYDVLTDDRGRYTKRVDPDFETKLNALKMVDTDAAVSKLHDTKVHGIKVHGIKEHVVRLRDGEHRKGYDFILK